MKIKQPSECRTLTQVSGVSVLIVSIFILPVFFTSACSASKEIVVKRAKESIERHTYDQGNRPESRVASHPSDEANTHWEFEFVPEIGVERISLTRANNQFVSVVRVKRVEVQLGLPIQVWLPASVTPKVSAHEGGHIEICRYFYSDAERSAHLAAEGIFNREFSGTGSTETESMQNAVESAGAALAAPFRNSVVLPASRASAIYDDLTKHGQAGTEVEAAVRAAIAQAK